MDKKETQKQKQKQKQTVIVNIGDKVIRRKRKRRPKKKLSASPPPPSSPFPPPPPQHDFAKVIFQAQPTPLRAEENLALQLNSVTQQLQDLRNKQDHATANLMASLMARDRDDQERAEAARAAEEAASKEAVEALIVQQLAKRVEQEEKKAKQKKESGSPQTAEPFKGDFVAPVADARVIGQPTFPQQPILGGGMVADPQPPPRQKKQIVSRGASARAAAAAEEPASGLKKSAGRPKGSVSKTQLKDPSSYPDVTSFF